MHAFFGLAYVSREKLRGWARPDETMESVLNHLYVLKSLPCEEAYFLQQ